MSLSQALKLAQVELAGLSGTRRLKRLGQIVRLFASEVAGTVVLAPFALKAQQIYNRLPAPSPNDNSSSPDEVHLVKSIYYGSRPRNTVDVYVPPECHHHKKQQQLKPGLPVVLFVHGGVWAAGDSWHYAPLGAGLARLGVITCVMQYTLYADALVPQLVQEVSAAFDWALENVAAYGGDPQQVSLVGHSAGAQLCMMALLQRAQAAHAAAAAAGQSSPSSQQQQQQQQQPLHLQMPRQFIGVTGVYDIAKHYAYEKDRGVHSLSTMLPAMGGFSHFAPNSPSVILAAALQRQLQADAQQQQQQPALPVQQQQQHDGQHTGSQQQQELQGELPACDFYNSFSLSGESISHRIGFDRGSDHYAAAEAGLCAQSLYGMNAVPDFPVEAAALLPPTVLMSSCSDLTVPWYESAELYWRLFDCGVPVKHLVYNKVGHGEFVTNWPAEFSGSDVRDGSSSSSKADSAAPSSSSTSSQIRQQQHTESCLQELSPYCRDLAVVVMGEQPVQFVHKSVVGAAKKNTVVVQQAAVNGTRSSQSVPVVAAAVSTAVNGSVPLEWN